MNILPATKSILTFTLSKLAGITLVWKMIKKRDINFDDITISRLGPERYADFRALRLESLKAFSEAFGSSYEEESSFSDEMFFVMGNFLGKGVKTFGKKVRGAIPEILQPEMVSDLDDNLVSFYTNNPLIRFAHIEAEYICYVPCFKPVPWQESYHSY